MADRLTGKETYFCYNTLISLIRGLLGEYTTIDLRDDSSVYGQISNVDGSMNVLMNDAVFTDTLGNEFHNDLFFLRERHIRYVHIPERLSINDTIRAGLAGLSLRKNRSDKLQKGTFRTKRLLKNQAETLALIEAAKSMKNTPKENTGTSDE